MEHAHPVNRPFSWRGAALAVALVGVVVLAVLGGMALLHRLGHAATAPVAHKGPAHHAAPLAPRSRESVLVLNGNGVNGAAGDLATRLLARGYRHAVPVDAPSHGYATSLVLYRPGFAAEAKRLSRDSHISQIAPLDGRLPAADASYELVVILGS